MRFLSIFIILSVFLTSAVYPYSLLVPPGFTEYHTNSRAQENNSQHSEFISEQWRDEVQGIKSKIYELYCWDDYMEAERLATRLIAVAIQSPGFIRHLKTYCNSKKLDISVIKQDIEARVKRNDIFSMSDDTSGAITGWIEKLGDSYIDDFVHVWELGELVLNQFEQHPEYNK
ncbi:MAG: hypothetical protein GF384_07110, partial [Elusimicrobia bacterium]|nr:hypothetical protein [Elusimicrobiota bacterium]